MIDKSDIKQWLESKDDKYFSKDDQHIISTIIHECFNDLQPQWVSVDTPPNCGFEHTEWDRDGEMCLFDGMVSNSFHITDGHNVGLGHYQDDGIWRVYNGEHDFMNIDPDKITHYKYIDLPK